MQQYEKITPNKLFADLPKHTLRTKGRTGCTCRCAGFHYCCIFFVLFVLFLAVLKMASEL